MRSNGDAAGGKDMMETAVCDLMLTQREGRDMTGRMHNEKIFMRSSADAAEVAGRDGSNASGIPAYGDPSAPLGAGLREQTPRPHERPARPATSGCVRHEELKSSFGEKLKFYRKQRKLSQDDLSKKIGITVKHLSAIERGLNFVSAELLEKLSRFLEIPIFLFFITDKDYFTHDSRADTIDRIITTHVLQTMEEIRSDIRQCLAPEELEDEDTKQ
jgi:transcriptional regulator with XRE-family HTH domain